MSWVPRDLSALCTPYDKVTECQPSTFMFIQLIVTLFGRSRDSVPASDFEYSYGPGYDPEYFKKHHGTQDYFPGSKGAEDDSEFDFIVAGAGSAGCIVASRLSEISDWRVLLLEGGGEEPEASTVPSLLFLMQGSSVDWNFATQPQPRACRARPQGRCAWPRGRVMGGSSAINYMIYLRGGPRDYNEWESLGNVGWSYKDVLPYFIKSEHNNNIEHVDPRFHGTKGEMSVEYFPYQDENVFRLLDGFKEMGMDIFDQNSDRQLGASLSQHTTRNGRRYSTNAAFIRPVRRYRKNLVVRPNSFVTKVLIDPQTKTAYGVEYVRNGKYHKATAKKEVIVSCGTLVSPKVLMLSGIGPAKHLQELNIDVIQELSVGHNLHDHTTLEGPVIAVPNTATVVSNEKLVQDTYKYYHTNRGPLSSTAMLQVNSYIQTKYETDEDRPDMQFAVDTLTIKDFYADPVLYGAATTRILSYYDAIMMRPILLAPKSRGYILLNHTDPVFGDPLIYANTFTDSQDQDLGAMVDAMQQIVHVVNTPSMQKIGASLVTTPLPGCEKFPFGTDDYWSCVSISYTTTLYHPVGTCKMGPKDDVHAVVDPTSLKVYGVKNLRVIDASVMPVVPRANTNAPTMMVAERGADFIKRDWLEESIDDEGQVDEEDGADDGDDDDEEEGLGFKIPDYNTFVKNFHDDDFHFLKK